MKTNRFGVGTCWQFEANSSWVEFKVFEIRIHEYQNLDASSAGGRNGASTQPSGKPRS